MKKLKFLYIAFFSASIGLFNSCADAVDVKPTNLVVGDASSIDSIDKASNLLIGSYLSLTSNNIGLGDITSDNAVIAATNTGQSVALYNWEYSEDTFPTPWIATYRALRDVNVVIAAVDNISTTTTEEEEALTRIKAEAYAVRAMANFSLLQQISPKYDASSTYGIPLVLTPVTANQQPPRATVADSYAQIESDLMTSIDTFGTDEITNINYFSKPSVYALAARVALTKGDWEDAKEYAQKSISISGTEVATRSNYSKVWRDTSTQGVLMQEPRGATAYMSAYNRVTNADVFYYAPKELYDSYVSGDIRKSFNFENDGGNYKVVKWPAVQSTPAIDRKYFRIEEMYLILAESCTRTGDLVGASTAINEIRKNRISGYIDVTYTDATVALADVIKERRLELAFEGFRFFDLKRLGQGIDRGCSGPGCNLDADSYLFTFPIPISEMRTNDNMVQNVGY